MPNRRKRLQPRGSGSVKEVGVLGWCTKKCGDCCGILGCRGRYGKEVVQFSDTLEERRKCSEKHHREFIGESPGVLTAWQSEFEVPKSVCRARTAALKSNPLVDGRVRHESNP